MNEIYFFIYFRHKTIDGNYEKDSIFDMQDTPYNNILLDAKEVAFKGLENVRKEKTNY